MKPTPPPNGAGIVLVQLDRLKRALTYKEIQEYLGNDSSGALKAVLDDLVKRGNLALTPKGRYKVHIPPSRVRRRLWA